MEDRRRFSRYQAQLKANYFSKGRKAGWEKCTIIDISRRGMGVIFLAREKVKVGSTIILEISVPTKLECIYIIGMVRWIKQRRSDFIGGVESTEIFDDVKLYYSPIEK